MEFDFSTNGELENLDKVPEQFRGVYQQGGDGKFVINETLKGVTDAITGLNKALKSERTQHTTLKGQKDVSAAVKEALGELGINSLDEAKAKIGELTTTLAEKGKIDPAKIRAEIEATFTTEREGFKGKLEKMSGTLSRYLVDAEANSQLNTHKGNVKLLLPVIKAQTKVVEDGEDFVVRVVDDEGSYRGDGKGGFMTVADLVLELKNSSDYKVAFSSDALPGGGSGGRQQQQSRQTQQRSQQDNDRKSEGPQDLISRGLAARRGRR